MASLTGQTISTTYDSLLKLTDNGPITASFKEITDGLGNSSGVFVKSTGQIKLGNYTTTTSFTGTAAGYLAFTSAGEIITTAIPSGGITSLNALTASTQTFAVGTSGTDFAISSATSTHTFNLPTASGTNRGALSSADWTTFNNKQNALTNPVTGTGTTNYVPKFTGSTAIGNSIIFDNGTQVGIGTASPASTLDVSGSITSSSNVRALRFWGGPSVFTSHGAPLHIFSSTIGTSAIARFNNNESTDASTLTSMWLENYSGFRAELAYTTHLNGSNIYINNTYSSGNILFNIAGSEKMRITSAGAVGIGTSSPGHQVHIVRANVGVGLQVENSSTYSHIRLQSAGTNQAAYLTFNPTGTGNAVIQVNDTDRLAITSAGNVGIGTTSPASKLSVWEGEITISNLSSGFTVPMGSIAAFNDDASNGGLVFKTSTSGTLNERLRILANGNVGIGTTSPTTGLVVNSRIQVTGNTAPSSGTGLELFYDGTGAGSLAFARGTGYIPNFMDGSQLQFFTSSSERMRITSAGNVGIGTTSPSSKLTVQDAANTYVSHFSGLNQTNGVSIGTNASNVALIQGYTRTFSATNNIAINADGGNVGIGTTSPSYQLQLSTDSAAKPTSALWTIASDLRIKENITPYAKGLKELMLINPINYDYNGLGGFKKGKGGVGIIAQEILNILPDSVSSVKGKLNEGDKEETDILNFNGHELTYVLINAIKEQQAQIEELKLLIKK
jgi:hypothetical protein